MKELNECLRLNREIAEINERLQTITAAAQAPKNQIISDMPRGGGSTVNATDRYIIKKEELEHKIAVINRRIALTWVKALNKMKKCGVSAEDCELMQMRFFYGWQWKKCACEMSKKHGKHWNVNRVFRIYRSVLTKCTK